MAKVDITKTERIWPGKYNNSGVPNEMPRVHLLHQLIGGKRWVCEATEAKDATIRDWRQCVTEQTGKRWEFARVNQGTFQTSKPKTLAEAVQWVSRKIFCRREGRIAADALRAENSKT